MPYHCQFSQILSRRFCVRGSICEVLSSGLARYCARVARAASLLKARWRGRSKGRGPTGGLGQLFKGVEVIAVAMITIRTRTRDSRCKGR